MNELAPTMVPASNSHCTLAEVQQVLDAGTRVGAAHALQTCVCVWGGGGQGGEGGHVSVLRLYSCTQLARWWHMCLSSSN
jgi:hypothetical protein